MEKQELSQDDKLAFLAIGQAFERPEMVPLSSAVQEAVFRRDDNMDKQSGGMVTIRRGSVPDSVWFALQRLEAFGMASQDGPEVLAVEQSILSVILQALAKVLVALIGADQDDTGPSSRRPARKHETSGLEL